MIGCPIHDSTWSWVGMETPESSPSNTRTKVGFKPTPSARDSCPLRHPPGRSEDMRKPATILAVLLTIPHSPAGGQEVIVTLESHDYEIRQDYTQREILRRGAGTLAYTEANFGLELAYQLAEGEQPGHITAILNAK